METKTTQKSKKNNPPKFLKGLFATILLITSGILIIGWMVINYQVEQLVATRSSEYAHSIAKIAANSSAEALMSGDKIQLKMLTDNVAKDPYIRSATIFAEDGQVVALSPDDLNPVKTSNTTGNSTQNQAKKTTTETATNTKEQASSKNKSESQEQANSKEQTNTQEKESSSEEAVKEQAKESNNNTSFAESYIQSQDDIPFIEKIEYQGVTAGWFKVSLNRKLLENRFRESLVRSQRLILVASIISLAILFFVIFHFNKKIKNLVHFAHKIIQRNAETLPSNKTEWIKSLEDLSDTRFQPAHETQKQHIEDQVWSQSRLESNKTFCYCEFSLEEQELEKTAECLSQAMTYFRANVQAHGANFEGSILTGAQVVFSSENSLKENLAEALTFAHVLKELLSNLELTISTRVIIGQSDALILENERGFVNGVSLDNRTQSLINQVTPSVEFGQIVFIKVEKGLLNEYAKTQTIHLNDCQESSEKSSSDNTELCHFHRCESINEEIKQQSNRQINYIMTNAS